MGKKQKAKAAEILALQAREAEIEQQLKAAAKLAKKIAKAKAKSDAPEAGIVPEVAEAAALPTKRHPHAEHIAAVQAAAATLASEDSSDQQREAAEAFLAESQAKAAAMFKAAADNVVEESTADIKARVKAKRAARAEGLDADTVDRDDEAAVRAYNDAVAERGGVLHLITSNADLARQAERVQGIDPDAGVEPPEAAKLAAREAEAAMADAMVARIVAESERLAEADQAAAIVAESERLEVEVQVAEMIETETGREFAVGVPADVEHETVTASVKGDEFATPTEAPPVIEFDGLGRYKIFNPETGKSKGYTRTTTYIDCLEDKSSLDKWKLRVLLEGVALNETTVASVGSAEMTESYPYMVLVRDEMHKRDVALARARKADRKGKLEVGELATRKAEAVKEFNRAMDTIAHDALELGGVHEKANKGTDLHALCELADEQGLDAVAALLETGDATPADLADVTAYVELVARLGIKMVESEQMVVNDTLGVAGRLDRLALFKFPGAQRAVRVIADIKTGRVDYSAGKIGMQLLVYATAKGYDLEKPAERRDLKASKTRALLIHLPQGTGTAFAYEVDLTLASKGLKLAGEVRAWRNAGKRVYDLKAPLAPELAAEEVVA